MTATYLLRHGRTSLSALHQVNGDPAVEVALDEVGMAQCQAVTDSAWIGTVVTCITSRFLRTRQTADHLLGTHRPERFIEPRLDEVPYGMFEGGPWLTYGAWLAEHGPFAVRLAVASLFTRRRFACSTAWRRYSISQVHGWWWGMGTSCHSSSSCRCNQPRSRSSGSLKRCTCHLSCCRMVTWPPVSPLANRI